MPYTKQTWTNDPSKTSSGLNGPGYEVNAEKLNHIEDGIATAQSTAEAGGGGGGGTAVNDADLVHKTGAETITGAKTFNSLTVSGSLAVPDDSVTSAAVSDFDAATTATAATGSFIRGVVYNSGAALPANPWTTGITVFLERTTATAAVNGLAATGSGTDAATYDFTLTRAIASGAFALAMVTLGSTGAAAAPPTSLSGGGVTWTKVNNATGSPLQGTFTNSAVAAALFIGTGTPSGTTLTVTAPSTMQGCAIKVVEVVGGSSTMVQALRSATTSSTTPGQPLTGTNSANFVIGFLASNETNVLTAGTGLTEVGTQAVAPTAPPILTIQAEWASAAQNTINWSGGGTGQKMSFSVEIARA